MWRPAQISRNDEESAGEERRRRRQWRCDSSCAVWRPLSADQRAAMVSPLARPSGSPCWIPRWALPAASEASRPPLRAFVITQNYPVLVGA